MPLNAQSLTSVLNEALGATNKNKELISPPKEMEAFAQGLVLTLLNATVTHPVITATAPPSPGPVKDIKALNGSILISPSFLIKKLKEPSNLAKATQIEKQAKAHTDYLQAHAQVHFDKGVLKGTSSAAPGTPPVPGFLTGGGTGGYITGINGEDWANSVIKEVKSGDLEPTIRVFTAISDYIKENALATYLPNTVSGAFASPGAPLTLGMGVSGKLN